MDILDEIEGKAVIWSHYQKDVQRLIKEIKKYGEGSVVYYGLTPQEERQSNIKKFQRMTSVIFCRNYTNRWLWYHTDCCGTMIYFSNGYDVIDNNQKHVLIALVKQNHDLY